ATDGIPVITSTSTAFVRFSHTDTTDHYPSWEAVYADNVNWVYRMLFTRVGNGADAEDLTADVFLTALKPLRMTATIAQVRGYLRAITRTVLAAHWREITRRDITSIDDVPDLPDDTGQSSTPHVDKRMTCWRPCRTTI